MPIDRFSKDRFEAALPRAGKTNALWQPLGLVGGEHCYVIAVQPGVLIYVRSSVRADGMAAETAEDSIRCWLASDSTGKPLGAKLSRWISRVSGWDARMTETFRTLWRLGKKLGKCQQFQPGTALHCQGQMMALRVKKQTSDHLGWWFSSCQSCGAFGDWLLDSQGNPPGPRVDKIVMKS